jgi:hypothetical protein
VVPGGIVASVCTNRPTRDTSSTMPR